MLDENQASYVPGDMVPHSYHCPNTACDGHFYMKPHELGHQQTCTKCGLKTTIGWQKVPHVAGAEGTRWRLERQTSFVRAAQRPEFRISIFACVIWLLLLRVY